MKKKLTRSMLLLALMSVLLTLCFVLPRLYTAFERRTYDELRDISAGLSRGLDQTDDPQALLSAAGRDMTHVRLSLIDDTGRVLYDSNIAQPEQIENHADREEIAGARQSGEGTASRLSASLGENTVYYARKLADGSFLRLAKTERSVLAEVFGLLPSLALIVLLVTGFAVALAELFTKRLIEPMNRLNLERPEENDTYEELSPLLKRIAQQNAHIEAQLRENQDNLLKINAITENMAEGLLLLSPDGKILSINKSAARLLGSTDAATVGHPYIAACRSLDLHLQIEQALSGRQCESRVSLASQTYHVLANPVYSQGEISGVLVLLLNITGQERAEMTRREFSANVSHELKTPLTTIAGYAEMMQAGLSDAQDNAALAGKILAEARRLLALIEDIMKLSQMDEAQAPAASEAVDLYVLAQGVAARMEPFARQHGTALTLQGEKTVVSGLPSMLEEMVQNLIDNAIRYNVEGGSVTIDIGKDARGAILRVTDTGVGIDPEHHDRIFERFYRVDKSHSRETGGTGLGLSIVKHAVLLHGGSISLESRRGHGTAIEVVLPLAE